MDERTRIVETLLAIVGRAVYSDGVVEEAEKTLVKRVVRALEVEPERAREILQQARAEVPMRASAGPADAAMLWSEAKHLLASLPPGTGRRALAARVGWALEVEDGLVAEVVAGMSPDPAQGTAKGAAETDAAVDVRQAADDSTDGSLAEPADAGTYAQALAGAARDVTRDDDPASGTKLLEVLDAAETQARAAPASPERMVAWASQAREAVRFLAKQRDWTSVRAIERRLAATPRELERVVAPATAGALGAWGAAALAARAPDELSRARDRLARLAGRHEDPVVRREYAGLLAALVTSVVRDHFPDASEGPLAAGLLESQAQAHWEDRELVLAFAAACPDIQLLHTAARDDAGHRKLLARLSELVQRHPRDEELALHLARGLVNAGVVRAGDLAPARREKDPLLVALRGTLDQLLEANPGSASLSDMTARFDRQPGVPASRIRAASAAAGSVTRARHPDLNELRDAFERLQHGSHDSMATMARILGVGPYLGRVMREGEDAYAHDEPYFLDMLEEIDYQIQHDRSGYWRGQMPKLDTMTRYLLEDATPSISAAARALRARLKLAAK